MTILLMVLLMQTAELSTPTSKSEKEFFDKNHKILLDQNKVNGSKKAGETVKSALVDNREIPFSYDVISRGKELSEATHRSNIKSIYGDISIPECQRTSSNPAGSRRVRDGLLNGRISFFQCRKSVLVVSIFDFSSATNPSVNSMIKDASINALVNGGYRNASILRSRDGRIEVTVNWLSKTKAKEITINFYAQDISENEAEGRAYKVLDALSKG